MARRHRPSTQATSRRSLEVPSARKGVQLGGLERQDSSPTKVQSFAFCEWLFVTALVVSVLLVYQPAWQGGFIWDDDAHVTKPELRSWHGLYRIWFHLGATQQYYPLLHSAFWVEHRLWGDATLGYHLVNILLHAAAAVLVALVLRRLKVPGAYLAAAIFALHPVHVESVAWITEQKNTLSAVFYLGAMLVYLRFDQGRKSSWYYWALVLFLLGLLSKTTAATLPAALLVIFWWQRGRLSWRRDVLPLVPFFVLGAMAGLFTAWVERKLIGAEGAAFALTIVERCLLAGRAIWFYLGKLLWPTELIFIYPRWQVSQTVWWQYLFPAAALLLLAGCWALRRRWRGPLAGLLFFVGTLFPVLGFCNVFPFLYSFVADHFQYLASLGVITLVSAGAVLLLQRWALWRHPAGYVACFVLLGALGTFTWRQSRMYSDIESLYLTTIDRNPDCWMAHNNLGAALAGQGRFAEAIAHYQKTTQIKPDFAEAHGNLGLALASQGRFDEAMAQHRKALEIKPDSADFHNNLGNALAHRGRFDEAIAEYRRALEINPRNAEAYNKAGLVLAHRGRFDEAIAQYRRALEIKPDFVEALDNFGNALGSLGRIEEAMAHYRKALEIDPDNAEAHTNLGYILTRLGRLDEAMTHYRKALEIKPDTAELQNNVALALAGQGRLDEAVAHYRKALKLNPDYLTAYNGLGLVLAARGRLSEAITQYRKALAIQPDCIEAHANLGNALLGLGQADEALEQFRKIAELSPRDAVPRNNLGVALAAQGRFDEALAAFQKALQIQPDFAEARKNLGWLRATCPQAALRSGNEAIEHARRADQLFGGQRADVLDVLAAAYAEAGRFPDALTTARKALDLARRQKAYALADVLRTRIVLYEAGKPFHQAPPRAVPPPKR